MTSSVQLMFVVVLCVALAGCNAAQPLRRGERISVKYVGLVMPAAHNSGDTPGQTPAALVPGQEARFRVTLVANTKGSAWATMFFNATAGSAKVRIIPAFASRGSGATGSRVKCNSHTDFWQEYWGLTSFKYSWGQSMVTQAYVTFTVPPFPWRVCLQAVSSYRNTTLFNATAYAGGPMPRDLQRFSKARVGQYWPGKKKDGLLQIERFIVVNSSYEGGNTVDGVWQELSNMDTAVQYVNASAPYSWTSSTTMYAGDFAAIKIQQNGYQHDLNIPATTSLITADLVKLVPGGFPCTYEKIKQPEYCGYNRVTLRGQFHPSCLSDGSVKNGIMRIGSNQYNPYSMAAFTARTLTLTLIKGGEDLVAYTQLPDVGTYDVCFSPKAKRTFNSTGLLTPVWFKIFKQDAPCTGVSATTFKSMCNPKERLVVTANVDPLRWSTPHIYPGTWGAIRIYHPAAGLVLNTNKATSWEHSSTREFFATVGGDQFRLVDLSRWSNSPITTGNLYKDANGATFKTVGMALRGKLGVQLYQEFERITSTATGNAFGASGDSLVVRAIGNPDQGSSYTLSSSSGGGGGCWYWNHDNYGNYGKALNGIVAAMNAADRCCAVGSGTSCVSSTLCSLSDTDNDGVTASADLGADPRTHQYAWTFNGASQSEAWAYIRFPISRMWNVCYRRVGTENWRVIAAASGSVTYFDPNNYKELNYTYHVNDSQATTWGPLSVRDPQKTLTTLNHNYISADTTIVGSSVKLVKNSASCYTDNGEAETFDKKPGLKECEVGCVAAGTCTAALCMGHADDSNTARWEVTFYVRMPAQLTSDYYRVCFKNGAQNWMQLQDPKYIKHSLMTSPWKFNTRVAPQLDFGLKDWRENTWGKFLIRRLANPYTQAFNIDANNAFGSGDVVRLVQNRTSTGIPARCDNTWGATSSNGEEFVLQNWVATRASSNLGIYCPSATANADATLTPSTSKCYSTKIAPSDAISGDVGTYPYINLDSTADGSNLANQATEGAVAFITIPPKITTGTAGYRLCYKPQASNWIEVMKIWDGAPNPFVVGTKPLHVYSVSGAAGGLSQLWAGQYGYFTISGGTVSLDNDLVKLVLDTSGGCDRPAAGTLSAGNTYASFSWRKLSGSTWTEAGRGGQAFVASSAPTTTGVLGSRGTTTSARAYMSFPTIAGLTAVTTNYKVCYMSRSTGSTDESNWQNLGTVGVYSPGVAYTAESQPYNGGVLGIRLVTGGTLMLNTLPRVGDAAKIVGITSPCYGVEWSAADRPASVLSTHIGQDTNFQQLGLAADNVTLLETGVDDLGDSNLAATATSRFEVTLPWVTAGTAIYYKVCYRAAGKPWIELNQAPLAQQKYALGTDNIKTSDAGLSMYTIDAKIMGQLPFTGALYATGIAYTDGVMGGAATAVVAATNSSYLYVTYKADFTSYATDTFKLVFFAEEIVRGTYVNQPNVNCKSPGLIQAAPGTGSVGGNPTRSSFAINVPTAGGRYLLCYKKTGLDVWLQLKEDSNSAGNPFRVIPNSLSFTYSSTTGNFTVTDLFSAQIVNVDTALGALNPLDKIYIVNASDTCGISHSYAFDPNGPTSTASIAANIDNAPVVLKGTSNVSMQASYTAPTAAGYYKLCYQRTSTKTMATAAADTLPMPYTRTTYVVSTTPGSWFQIENKGATSNGGNTPFYVTAKAAKLRINKCPSFNASNPLRTGQPVEIAVSVLDAQNIVLPFAVGTWSYLITAMDSASATAPTFVMANSVGSCRAPFATQYGWEASNLRQWTAQGVVTFSLAILSGCPTGGCAITFGASDGIKAPGGVDTRIDPARCTLAVRTTTVASMGVWEGVTTCKLDATCLARIAVFWTDGGLAHTATDDVLMTATNIAGLSVKANNVALSDTTGVKAGSLANGYFDVSIVFDVTSGTSFAADTAVVLKFSAGGKNATHTMTVIRPIMKKMYVVDLYPADQTVTGLADNDKFVRPSLVPSWEPVGATYFPGMVSVAEGKGEIAAAAGYHLVAMQPYTAVLRPVDASGMYIDKAQLLPSATITLTNTAASFTGNKILRPCDTEEVCNTAFSGVSLSSTSQKVTFSLMNAIGCTRASPCTLTFKFDGADLTGGMASITTPVRSMATGLKVTCWQSTATTEAALGAGTAGACPSTTVEVGLALKIEAVDGTGQPDEFFEGNVLPLLSGGSGYTTDNGINLTTVAALKSAGAATIAGQPLSFGKTMIYGLTLTRACASGCALQLVTDWGAQLFNLGAIVVTPSTVKLTCALSSTLYACVVDTDGNCASISGYFGYDSAVSDNNKVSLIYKDTPVCATVTAVNANEPIPTSTLYETNWVMYWAQAMTAATPVVISDVGTSPTRVKAMVRSSVQFCFKVDSPGKAKATFQVRFAAQRFNDPTYWARVKTNGECSLGTFAFWGMKHIANLAVTKAATPMTAITTLPASNVNLWAQRADADKTALGTTLTFGLLDHYDKAILPTEVVSFNAANTVVISACSLDETAKKLSSACIASTIDATSSISMTASSVANQKEGGVVKATLTASAVVVNAEVSYTLTFDRWCLGCSLMFKVKTATGDYKTKYPGTAESIPTAKVNLYIVIHSAVASRVLAFRYGTSPWASYWQKYDATTVAANLPSTAIGNAMTFKNTCFSTEKSTCNPVESWFQPTVCDEQTVGTSHQITSSNSGAAIQMYVLSTTAVAGATVSTTNEPSCGTENNCNTVANVIGQVDILNSYTVNINIGTQVLQCAGTACADDLTVKPKQTIEAMGATAIDAIKSFITAATFRSTSFIVSGVYPSNYYALSSGKLSATETPSYASALTVTAESNVTGTTLPSPFTTSAYSFVFRGPKVAAKFAVLAAAKESKCPTKPTYACHGTACGAYDGYQKMASLDTIAYKYGYVAGEGRSVVPIATEIPITAEVEDASSVRVATAKGTVTVELYSWSGCNNGGTMTVKGAVNNKELALDSGRVTAWVSFSAPCERCVLRFTLVSDSTQNDLYAAINLNKAMLTQYSTPIDVRDNVAKIATHLIATSTPADQKSAITVSDEITVNMIPVVSIGAGAANMQISDRLASGTAYAYNVIQTAGRNPFWFGNGGVLRKDTTTAPTAHHVVSAVFANTGAVSLKFTFTRTCPTGCQVVVTYTVNDNVNSFLVKNNAGNAFTVTAASTKYMLIGYRPRMVRADTDFALSLWHVGEGAGVSFAGVGATTMSPAKASKNIEDPVNGDGGAVIIDQAFVLTKTEIHRVRVPRSCNRLRIALGTDTARMLVYTVATGLRVERDQNAARLYQQPMTGFASYGVYAVDDLGFLDVRVGGYTGGSVKCFSYDPMACSPNQVFGSTLTCSLLGLPGGFNPMDNNFLAAGSTVATFDPSNNKIIDGQATNVRVQFANPVRQGFPNFKVGSLTADTIMTMNAAMGVAIDVSVGKTGLNIVTKRSTDTTSMYAPIAVEIGLVKLIADATATSPTSYIAVEADNVVKATLGAGCPALVAGATTEIPLNKGYAQLALAFAAPTTGTTKCTVTVTALAGSGVCSSAAACTTSFQISVTSVVAAKWAWVSPSAMDNTPGLPAGPYYGAQGRTTIFRVSLAGVLSATSDIQVTNCDDPSTANIETCTLAVSTEACTNKPTIGTQSWNLTSGIGSISVTWADVTTGTYNCKLTVSVTSDGVNKVLTNIQTPGGNVDVSVCKPAGIKMTTNSTTAFREMFLRSGAPYSFSVAIVDSKGAHCRGDSAEAGTELQADLVSADLSAKAITSMSVYNTNISTTAQGWVPPNARTAKATAGTVTFTLWFTNSSVNLGLGGFRVRVTPSKGLTSTGGALIKADSGVLDTVIAASTLRFDPSLPLPRNWVMGRPLNRVRIQAVDGLDPRMVPLGPNVARKMNELGNNEKLTWLVEPLPTTGFPLSFSVGSQEGTTLTAGEADFVPTFSTSRDGQYGLSVATPSLVVRGTQPQMVNFQTISSVMIVTEGIAFNSPDNGPRIQAPPVCNSGCLLPNRTFQVGVNNSVQFLNTTNLRGFNVTILLADANGRPVIGENQSFIQVRLVKDAASTATATLTIPESYTARDSVFWAPVREGVAMFTLGFVGSTLDKSGTSHSTVSLEFSCPATVPAAIAQNSADIKNPCASGISKSTATTMPIRVIDPSVPAAVFNSVAVQASRPVVRIPTTIKSLALFNITNFKLELAKRMTAKFPFITADNSASVIELVACEVIRATFGNADLGSSVCGASGKCSGSNTECPTGVVKCTCNKASALSALLGRYLLQTTGAEVQIEATYNLQNAVGFAATSEGAIASMYASLGESTTSVLKNDVSFSAAFGVDTANVGVRSASAPVVTQTPQPTPVPPPPATPAPTPAIPAPTPSSGNSLCVSMTSVLAALLLLALFW